MFRSESRTRKRTNLMVFLRPVVMRDGEASTRFSVDRYDQMRARGGGEGLPPANALMPVNPGPPLGPAQPGPADTVPADGSPARPSAP